VPPTLETHCSSRGSEYPGRAGGGGEAGSGAVLLHGLASWSAHRSTLGRMKDIMSASTTLGSTMSSASASCTCVLLRGVHRRMAARSRRSTGTKTA